MRRVLTPTFFNRDARLVARELIGKYLVVGTGEKVSAHMITETEAYVGPEDKASHAAKGLTPRTRVMFGKPGVWYVYFVYGMYDMLNVVTGAVGHPAAVLIRGVADVAGPGKLTRALGLTKVRFNEKPVVRATGLWIEDRGTTIAARRIMRTPRIGVDYAGEWAAKPFRFVLQNENKKRKVVEKE